MAGKAKQQTEETALAPVAGNTALAIPDWMKEDQEAVLLNVDFDQSEVKLPQLKICQSMSPERKRTDPNYIEGLQDGDLFNSATGQNYGQGPLRFVMLKFWVNFIKFEEGNTGNILCRGDANGGCELNNGGLCPNAEFKGKEKPTCTKFMNYLVYLLDTNEIVWFSAKSTGLKTMRQFNSSLRAVNGIADFAKVFTLSTAPDKNAAGQEYYIPAIPKRVSAFVTDQPLYLQLKDFTQKLRDKSVDTSAAEVADEGGAVSGDKVPF